MQARRFSIALDQRGRERVFHRESPCGGELLRGGVAAGDARSTSGEPGRDVGGPAAQLHDVDPSHLLHSVTQQKTLKNRVRLDLRSVDDAQVVRVRLIDRGAQALHHGGKGPHTWVTMTDPEGNEFCV